jgi:hypothetical protein
MVFARDSASKMKRRCMENQMNSGDANHTKGFSGALQIGSSSRRFTADESDALFAGGHKIH